jgi:hypothetical protein
MPSRILTFVLLASLAVAWPPSAFAAKILLLAGGDTSNDAQLESVLQTQGNTVTLGPTYSSFTGSGLSNYNAVMLMPNGAPSMADMPASGQQALVTYVNSGGGLVTGEPTMSMLAYPGDFKTLSQAFPAIMGGANTANSPIVLSALTSDAVMNTGLPSTFSFSASGSNTETYLVPKPYASAVTGITSFYSTNQWNDIPGSNFRGNLGAGSGLIGGTFGNGRVVNISTWSDNTALSDSNYDKLVSNAVNWAAQTTPGIPHSIPPPAPPIPGSIPEPTSLAIFIATAVGLLARSRSRRFIQSRR